MLSLSNFSGATLFVLFLFFNEENVGIIFSYSVPISLRILWPLNEAWILVAALFNSGSLRSISSSSATFLVISCMSTSSGVSLVTTLRVKWPRKAAWIFAAASHSSRMRVEVIVKCLLLVWQPTFNFSK